MISSIWLRDSLTRRFAIAIAATAVISFLLNVLLDSVIGGPAIPAPAISTLLDALPATVGLLDRAPAGRRADLAKAASRPAYSVDWVPADLSAASGPGIMGMTLVGVGAATDRAQTHPPTHALMTTLQDGSSLAFTPRAPGWSFPRTAQWLLRIAILVYPIMVVATLGAARLAGPIDAFAAAARRFGTDPNAHPITLQGPEELQSAIAAFNTMQSQIQRFVAGQAAMFAAISHDLRTPLTRMRLRGEFIENQNQQARLFRDIDEMQTMVSAMLNFLRDNAADEATTTLDLAELLRSIVDDYADLGSEVTYYGPRHLAYPGRPIGLRRAFGNLVDNAVKYGVRPTIALQPRTSDVQVTIIDHGPGIPTDALEAVFAPFQRLEPSRNRQTGGMGLGLTAARAGFRAHGGDVALSNEPTGGLRALVTLPRAAQ